MCNAAERHECEGRSGAKGSSFNYQIPTSNFCVLKQENFLGGMRFKKSAILKMSIQIQLVSFLYDNNKH